jgi:hypothetical protein
LADREPAAAPFSWSSTRFLSLGRAILFLETTNHFLLTTEERCAAT